eukprot:7375049-Ditylum_brightwellii.AAC.1
MGKQWSKYPRGNNHCNRHTSPVENSEERKAETLAENRGEKSKLVKYVTLNTQADDTGKSVRELMKEQGEVVVEQ